MNALPRQALWQRLRDAELVEGDLPDNGKIESPWYVRVMLGVAGWIGSFFLFGFIAVGFSFVVQSAGASLIVGAMASGGAFALFRTDSNNDFVTQIGLAIGLVGQMLLVYGLYELLGLKDSLFYLLVFVIEALLTLAMPNFIYRVMTTIAAMVALSLALGRVGVYGVAEGSAAAGFALIWLQEIRWIRFGAICRPAGYGLALYLLLDRSGMWRRLGLYWPGSHGAESWIATHAPWLGKALIVAVLLTVVFALLRRMQIGAVTRPALAILGAAALITIASISVPGIAQSLLILIVGFAVRNRVLIGLGLLAFGGFISSYYYLMQSTLLEKSIWLIGLGAVLIGGRLAMRQWLSPAAEGGRDDA